MGYYQGAHAHYCGIDLHSTTMFVSICDASGTTLVHRQMPADPERLGRTLAPYQADLVVACECTFSWYWLADWCQDAGIPFVLGHALGMAAIHQAKVKDDSRDADTIVRLLRTGYLPMAYVYDRQMRATRGLMRRRMALVHMQTQLLNHAQILSLTHKRQRTEKKMVCPAHRLTHRQQFDDPMLQASFDTDLNIIDSLQVERKRIERLIRQAAKRHAPQELHRLRTIPGIGEVLSQVILYEIHTIGRFHSVGHFISYCRLITPEHRSGGKRVGSGNRKIGNKYLRWAFGEAAVLMLRESTSVKHWYATLANKKCKAKALSILSARIARTAYYLLKNEQVFDEQRFLGGTFANDND